MLASALDVDELSLAIEPCYNYNVAFGRDVLSHSAIDPSFSKDGITVAQSRFLLLLFFRTSRHPGVYQ